MDSLLCFISSNHQVTVFSIASILNTQTREPTLFLEVFPEGVNGTLEHIYGPVLWSELEYLFININFTILIYGKWTIKHERQVIYRFGYFGYFMIIVHQTRIIIMCRSIFSIYTKQLCEVFRHIHCKEKFQAAVILIKLKRFLGHHHFYHTKLLNTQSCQSL